jgi:hypothetical protein
MDKKVEHSESQSADAERLIRRFVPKLASDIRKAVEEKMAELDRPLSPQEVEECATTVGAQLVLRLFGEPHKSDGTPQP